MVYAIGDVHGCRTELENLLELIVADGSEVEGEKWVVGLGDYVDRGPDSAGVIDTILDWQADGFRSFWLAGNHDVVMDEAAANQTSFYRWMGLEGAATLRSYDLDPLALARSNASGLRAILSRQIPQSHMDFLKSLPLTLELPGVVFVHAGIRAGVPVSAQKEADLLWMRSHDDQLSRPDDPLVIHGHTPGSKPTIMPRRICIDTGVVATGLLSAVRLAENAEPKFLFSR